MFETAIPCIVELMGHNRIAGMVSEQELGGTKFVRVDVPAVEGEPGFTKLFGSAAIYAVTPTDEETMIRAVRAFRSVPIERWALNVNTRPALAAGDDGYDDDMASAF
ncbi:MAG: hypothetical protein LC130_23110 [Bryobacterales bacterium]|nr:hypothetical protein [Bryobacterales bacterium]